MTIDYYIDSQTDSISGWRRVFLEYFNLTKEKVDYKCISFKPRFGKLPFSRYINYLIFYPWLIYKNKRRNAIAFLPHQELAYLLYLFRFKKSVVICHDIIPFLFPTNIVNYLFFVFAMKNIKKANKIVVDSYNTKNDLIKYFNCDEKQIEVIYPAVNSIFRPKKVNTNLLLKKYNIPKGYKYILYVGSEAKQKNIAGLLKAYKKLENQHNIYLIKIGKAGNTLSRKRTLKLIEKLSIKNISIVENVSEDSLVDFYNISTLLVYPSLYEGFGLPPLEAMACGCPVVTSNISSIPEIVENAAVLIDPTNIADIKNAIFKVLTQSTFRKNLKKRGLLQSKKFKWEIYAKNIFKIYRNI